MTASNKKWKQGVPAEDRGLVLFSRVREAILAQRVLNSAGYLVRLVAPPAALRKGCDLALEINLVEKLGIERLLSQKKVTHLGVTPLKIGTSELVELIKMTDFGRWLMVKAGNMKITFDKESGVIVNISGGGCPDIPYLHVALAGRLLTEAPQPSDSGFTLCALMLDQALEEGRVIWQGGKQP
jgi:hypothetical protein